MPEMRFYLDVRGLGLQHHPDGRIYLHVAPQEEPGIAPMQCYEEAGAHYVRCDPLGPWSLNTWFVSRIKEVQTRERISLTRAESLGIVPGHTQHPEGFYVEVREVIEHGLHAFEVCIVALTPQQATDERTRLLYTPANAEG